MKRETENNPLDLADVCGDLRIKIKDIENIIRLQKEHNNIFNAPEKFDGQHGETKAQLMLAVRHLEDARMRLGKAIQYSKDGVSCYDR